MICHFAPTVCLIPFAELIQQPLALAHIGHHHPVAGLEALQAGMWHPLLGLDHWLAMLASGLLAVQVQNRHALALVPLTFVGLMLVGGMVGSFGIPLLMLSWMVSLSVILLGLAIATFRSLPMSLAAGMVGLCAIGHGYLHMFQMEAVAMLPFFVGLSLTTLALHGMAIAIGLWALQVDRPALIRIAGAGIVVSLSVFLLV